MNRSVNLAKLLQSDVLGFEDYQMNLEICRLTLVRPIFE